MKCARQGSFPRRGRFGLDVLEARVALAGDLSDGRGKTPLRSAWQGPRSLARRRMAYEKCLVSRGKHHMGSCCKCHWCLEPQVRVAPRSERRGR